MVVETKPVEAKKEPIAKTVPASVISQVRKELTDKLNQMKEQLGERDQKISGLESSLAIAKSKMEDEDVADVKKDLLRRDKELQDLEVKASKRETSLKEKEKEVRVKELVHEYKGQGIELDVEALMAADDPRDIVLEAMAAHLAQKKEEPPEEKPSVYETGPAATGPKKMPKDMNKEELAQYEKEGLAITMAKR